MPGILRLSVIGCALLFAAQSMAHAQVARGRDTSADAQIRESHRAAREQQRRDPQSGSAPIGYPSLSTSQRSDCLTPDGCRLVDRRRAAASAPTDDSLYLPDQAADLGRYLVAREATAQSDTRVCIEAIGKRDRPGVRLPPAEYMRRREQAEADIKRCQEANSAPFDAPLERLKIVLSNWAAQRPVNYEGLRQLGHALVMYNAAWGVPGVDAAEKLAGARVLAIANPIIEARKAALENILRPQIIADVSKPENDMLIDDLFPGDPRRRQFYADRRRAAISPRQAAVSPRPEARPPAPATPPRATQSGLFGLRIGFEHPPARYREAADDLLDCSPTTPAALRNTGGAPPNVRHSYGCRFSFGLFELYDNAVFHVDGGKLRSIVRVYTPRIAPGCENYQQVIASTRLANNAPGADWKLVKNGRWRRDTPVGSVQEGWRIYQKGDVYAHVFSNGAERSGGDRCRFELPVVWTVYTSSPPSAAAPPLN